ncbi:RluA family pseudouridine synthase [Myxacorys almedinensis]|uniref:Pseudouridine synthase n=1 Tax=Myxacorys almedinensis A TaxID=2690445 RepID=A0A8J7Z172_9CYAN|nr:RluA family pseudouridine synthase [Myxacorys almedinensis]NDJ18209.1 RluA family pseudouridine synthase [Myxacorys almedinensis A]
MTKPSLNPSLNQGWIYRDRITAPVTLLDYYATRYTHSSRQDWCDRIQSGLIFVDHHAILDPQTLLSAGQVLSYHRPPWVEPDVPFDVAVLYEDHDVLILSKPSGLPVLPGGGFLDHTLLGWLKRHYDDPPIPMHRLGRGTSGAMLLAKTEIARSKLAQMFRDSTILSGTSRAIQKIYRALATRTDQPDAFTVTHPIGKVTHPTLGYLYAATSTGKAAISHCRVLRRGRIPDTTLLEVIIPTGRPHQIRIHLATAGYPLWGDPLYGVGGMTKASVPGDCGYFLHAYQVSLPHPTGGYQLTVTAQPPDVLS